MKSLWLMTTAVLCTSCVNIERDWTIEGASFPDFRLKILEAGSGAAVAGIEVCAFARVPVERHCRVYTYGIVVCGNAKRTKVAATTTDANGVAQLALTEPLNYRVFADKPGDQQWQVGSERGVGLKQSGYVNGDTLTWSLEPDPNPHIDGYGKPANREDVCDE